MGIILLHSFCGDKEITDVQPGTQCLAHWEDLTFSCLVLVRMLLFPAVGMWKSDSYSPPPKSPPHPSLWLHEANNCLAMGGSSEDLQAVLL